MSDSFSMEDSLLGATCTQNLLASSDFFPNSSGSFCLLPVFLVFLVVGRLTLQNVTLPRLPRPLTREFPPTQVDMWYSTVSFQSFFIDQNKAIGLAVWPRQLHLVLFVATVKEAAEENQHSVGIIKKCFCRCGHPRGRYSSFLASFHYQQHEAVTRRICPVMYSIF